MPTRQLERISRLWNQGRRSWQNHTLIWTMFDRLCFIWGILDKSTHKTAFECFNIIEYIQYRLILCQCSSPIIYWLYLKWQLKKWGKYSCVLVPYITQKNWIFIWSGRLLKKLMVRKEIKINISYFRKKISTCDLIAGDSLRAASILETLEKLCPNVLVLMVRRINLFRRRGDFDQVCSLYEQYINATAEKKEITSSLAIKYARFCNKVWNRQRHFDFELLACIIWEN